MTASTDAAVRLPTRDEAEQFLYREARLLDERRLDEWLELFTPDGIYWLPIPDEGDGHEQPTSISLIYADTAEREERVWRTLHTPVLDQRPRSRTLHSITNVEVDPEPVEDAARVWCGLTIAEIRTGGQRQIGLNEQRFFAARCEYRLRPVVSDSPAGWRILLKKVTLLNADQPLYNLTFVV